MFSIRSELGLQCCAFFARACFHTALGISARSSCAWTGAAIGGAAGGGKGADFIWSGFGQRSAINRDRADYEQKVSAATQRVVALGFLREEEVSHLVAEAGAFYDRVVAHDPADRSCFYLFPK